MPEKTYPLVVITNGGPVRLKQGDVLGCWRTLAYRPRPKTGIPLLDELNRFSPLHPVQEVHISLHRLTNGRWLFTSQECGATRTDGKYIDDLREAVDWFLDHRLAVPDCLLSQLPPAMPEQRPESTPGRRVRTVRPAWAGRATMLIPT
jgi:hypothetical protein